jgi:hypothetical protein
MNPSYNQNYTREQIIAVLETIHKRNKPIDYLFR